MSVKTLRITPTYRYLSLGVELELSTTELELFHQALEHATVFGQNPPGCSVSRTDRLWLRAGSTNFCVLEKGIVIAGLPPIKANIPSMDSKYIPHELIVAWQDTLSVQLFVKEPKTIAKNKKNKARLHHPAAAGFLGSARAINGGLPSLGKKR